MPRRTTRNAQGSGTIRQLKNGKWEGRYTVGRSPATGKQIQKSIYGDTQQEVRRKLQHVTASIDAGTYTEPSKMTVKTWLEIWQNEYLGNVKPFTASSYAVQCNNHIIPALGAVKLSALNTPMIQAFYNSLQKEHKQDGKAVAGLSPKTIKNIHGVLHKALSQAQAIGYIRFNPSDACSLPRVAPKTITPLDEAETAAFIEAVQQDKFATLFLVDLFTGMRQGEILGLTWDCVDFDNGTIIIEKQLQHEKKVNGKYYWAPLKNDKSRMISPASTIIQTLQIHRKKQIEQRLLAGELWDEGELPNLVFTDELGGHLAHMTVFKHFKKVVASIGRPDARFHDLRHTYAVSALKSGDDIKTVQETLGHHAAAFTLDVYGHVTQRMRQDSAARMERYIQSLKTGQ